MKKILLGLVLISVCGMASALPFDIVYSPGQPPIPTTIVPGQTITVFYTVTNNTGSTRNNNILHLPSNTTQVTGPGLCTNPINLLAGASCVLQLSITGTTGNCNPPLLLCFPGNQTCAGTEDQLNIDSVSDSSLRSVAGGNVSAPATPPGLSNLVEVSLNDLDTWERQVLGIPSTTLTDDSVCVGSGSTASCTLVGSTGLNGLINQSRDGGITWANITGLTLTNNPIYGVDCTDSNFCVAVGHTTPGNVPYIAVSTGTAGTWTDTGFTNLPPSSRTLADAACAADGSICIASGLNTNTNISFIFQSTTPGTPGNWTVATPDPSFTETLKTASCTEDGGLCMAAGGDSSASIPKIIQTTDQGTTWVLAHTGAVIIEDSSCTGSGSNGWCIAVGKNTTEPRIFYTTDSGATSWTGITPVVGTQYNLLGTSCTGTTTDGLCVAVGFNSSTNLPFIVRSQNAASWTVVANSNISGLPASATLADVSCTGDTAPFTCVAVGRDITNNRSMIIKSTDSGQNWTVDTTGPVTDGSLNTVSITGG